MALRTATESTLHLREGELDIRAIATPQKFLQIAERLPAIARELQVLRNRSTLHVVGSPPET